MRVVEVGPDVALDAPEGQQSSLPRFGRRRKTDAREVLGDDEDARPGRDSRDGDGSGCETEANVLNYIWVASCT